MSSFEDPSSSSSPSRLPTVTVSRSTLVGCLRVQPYGRAVLQMHLRRTQENEGADSGDLDADGSSAGVGISAFPDERIQVPTYLTKANIHKYNYYEILGFSGEWADSADTEAIRRAYHKAVLLYHPDKAKNKSLKTEADRSVFLKIQDAFNVLSNQIKRRAYDSTLEFDETSPSEQEVDEMLRSGNVDGFFHLFDPIFKRNARFAVRKPVPEIGNMTTPLNKVFKFYEYWVKFDSWRDFSNLCTEYNVDNASCREEKRWIQKEIDKFASKHKRQEIERIIQFVTLAQKKDPRIAADRDAKRMAKEAEKQAKEDEVRRKAEEIERQRQAVLKAEEDAKAKLAEMKADKEKFKKMCSKAKNIFKKLLRVGANSAGSNASGGGNQPSEFGALSHSDVDLICTQLDYEDLCQLNEGMGGEAATKDPSVEGYRAFEASGLEAVMSQLKALVEKKDREAAAERAAMEEKKEKAEKERKEKEAAENAKKAPERAWSRDQLSMLAKAVSKHPAGLSNRWELVTKFMNDQLKPASPFLQDELIKCAFNASKKSLGPGPK